MLPSHTLNFMAARISLNGELISAEIPLHKFFTGLRYGVQQGFTADIQVFSGSIPESRTLLSVPIPVKRRPAIFMTLI